MVICRIVIYLIIENLPKTLRKQSSSSPDTSPYCRLYERHLELYIGHCAEWWVLIPLEQQVIRQQLICTPYVPDRIERGQEFAVNLQLCNDLPGNEATTQEESRQQSYHRCHRSVPFNVETKAGDVTITCHREGGEIESQIVSLKDLLAKISQCISIYVPPSEDDLNFAVITITITQAGKLGISRSIAFVIRYTDEPVCQFPSEQTDITRTLEEVKNSDLQSDVDVLTIAQTMDVNQFYDLGIALGFTIAELDRVEYRRFRDRQQATFDMLLAWRGRQASTQAAKNTLITIIESFNSSSNDTTFPDIDPTEEISDCKLIQFSRHINKEKFYEIGKQLGFDDIELHHIEHRSLYNRKDANIQMLSMWKASQISSDKSDEKLKMVWESLNEASNVTDMNDDANSDDVTPLDPDVNSDPSPQETEEDEDEENEDWKIIEYLESDKDETIVDIDGHGGSPSNSELCTVVRPVANVTWALELAKALRLDVNDIIVLIAPRDPALMERLAWQLLHQWSRRLGRQENEEKVSTLLQGYNIENAQTGIGEICAKIRTTPDLIDLSQRLDLPASEILQVMASSLTFEPASIRRVVLQMLQRWVKQGGTRLRLLEVVQAFNFNDAAVHIARAIPSHPGFLDHLTHGIIDHDGGDLKLDEPDIRVSIPSGAIPKGMRSVVTLTILKGSLSKFPLDPGEVLVTPTIRCSSNHDLLKSATIALPHCIDPDQYQEKKQDLCVKLYSKIGPGEYGYRTLFPCSTRDFEISEDRVTFSTRHLQYFALSSNDIHGVQFICEVSQPLFISNSSHPTLRICIAHPCNTTGVRGQNCRLSELFHEVTTAIKFNLESAEDDIKISCLTGSEKTQETVNACSLLSGGCNTININLPSSTDDKIVRVSIEQGLVTLAEQEINIRKEVEPDYEIIQRRGRLRFVSNDVIQVLTGLVSGIKNASELGYQLGFSHSMVSKYLSRADSSASIASNAGLKEMLQDWRKRVRPSEQVKKLQLALETVGLRNEAEFIFHDT
ncbi:uncharacterized protein LOC121417590 [Lytechinus variegatus]|uniref:uncharacterized protein LOC121417590 n=1 Tax=Lytechinus variegatus TaxID=7654 RepID=UPI001BB265A7|nr:uncharacterized protein LOC121417590 [Lytechinus variegatus]